VPYGAAAEQCVAVVGIRWHRQVANRTNDSNLTAKRLLVSATTEYRLMCPFFTRPAADESDAVFVPVW